MNNDFSCYRYKTSEQIRNIFNLQGVGEWNIKGSDTNKIYKELE